jgi:hypothetical protein
VSARPGIISQSETAEAAPHDAACDLPVHVCDDMTSLLLEAATRRHTTAESGQTRQGREPIGERAAEAHELHAPLVVTAQQLLRMFKRALRQCRPQLRRRLQIMRAQAAGAEDGASSSSA